jgi:hypothetical protein
VSFVFAMLVGIAVLPSTPPRHSTSVSKPQRRQAPQAPFEMLPALPSLQAMRTDAPADRDRLPAPPPQAPKARQPRVTESTASKSSAGAPNAHAPNAAAHPLSVPGRGKPQGSAAAAAPKGAPRSTPTQPPAPEPQTEIVATIPPRGASQPPALSTTPPPTASPRDPNPAGEPPGRHEDPFTLSPPVSTLPPIPHVTQPRATALPESPSPSGLDTYVLGPGDQIEVNVPNLSVTVTIDPDGVIALPLISPIRAAGRTTSQLASELTTMYSSVLNAPSVTVFVRQYRVNR